ncbi:MAG TPA: hypothetical protein VMU95_41320 [Trebonia sp.]|nr:hypothetical protein [Trebonia sp.]
MSTQPTEPAQTTDAVTAEQAAGAAAHGFITDILSRGKSILAELEKYVPASLINAAAADGEDAAETVVKEAL